MTDSINLESRAIGHGGITSARSILDQFRGTGRPHGWNCTRPQTGGHQRQSHLAPPSAGPMSWVHVDLFGRSKLEWFQTFLELPGGIPSHEPSAMFLPVWTQSSSRVASWPGPKPSLSCCPRRWWPLTGRRARRSHDWRVRGSHALVSAWANARTP